MKKEIRRRLLKILHEQPYTHELIEELARTLNLNLPVYDDNEAFVGISFHKFARLAENYSHNSDVFYKICDLLFEIYSAFDAVAREIDLKMDDLKEG